jgi:hypothetical protein
MRERIRAAGEPHELRLRNGVLARTGPDHERVPRIAPGHWLRRSVGMKSFEEVAFSPRGFQRGGRLEQSMKQTPLHSSPRASKVVHLQRCFESPKAYEAWMGARATARGGSKGRATVIQFLREAQQ